MGITKVILKVKNPREPQRSIEEEFLVDSGAVYTVLSKKHVEKLGLKPSFNAHLF